MVPGLASGGDDRFVTAEDPVREFVLAKKLPDVLDRVQFGGLGRQRQQREVFRYAQLACGMPAGLVEYDNRMPVIWQDNREMLPFCRSG